MNSLILELKDKFQDQIPVDFNVLSVDLQKGLDKIQKQTTEIQKFPDQLKKEFEDSLNTIKNYYELSKHLMSFIIGLFDIKEEKLKVNLDYYFKDRDLAINIFGVFLPSKRKATRKNTLSSYLSRKKYADRYSSLYKLFNNWFMDYIRFIRNHEGHGEDSISGFGLIDTHYHIRINNTIQTFTLNEMKELESNIHQFYLWNKGLIARKYYLNDTDLFNYLN